MASSEAPSTTSANDCALLLLPVGSTCEDVTEWLRESFPAAELLSHEAIFCDTAETEELSNADGACSSRDSSSSGDKYCSANKSVSCVRRFLYSKNGQ